MDTNASELYLEPKKYNLVGKALNSEKENLFINIPALIRVFIIIYFLIYQFFFPIKDIIYNSQGFELNLAVIVKVIASFAILLPIIFKWKGVGLLHPLVWPPLFTIAKSIKSPIQFIAPFMGSKITGIQSVVPSEGLSAEMKLALLTLSAVLLTYGGYWLTKNKKINLKPKVQVANIRTRLIIWALFCLLLAVAFFISQGGVKSWIDSWGLSGGRAVAMEGLGPILSFIGGLYYIPTLWILCRKKKAIKDPYFWVFAIVFAFFGFLSNGSRYGILQAITTYLMAWVLINRNFPIVKVIIIGFAFLLLFGMLGMLRQSGTNNKQGADWSLLNQNASTYLDYAIAEGTERAQEHPDLAVMREVRQHVDYLYGLSYLYLVTTYIPRAIWPDKPHSGAYYTGYYIFNVNWGVPVGEIGEVYWNFGLIGFFIFFLIKGFIYKVFVNTFIHYHEYAAGAMIFFLLLFNGGDFSSLSLGDFLRQIVFLLVGLKFLKLL